MTAPGLPRSLATVVLATCLLAGCSSPDDGAQAPASTGSSSTPGATPTEPDQPTDATTGAAPYARLSVARTDGLARAAADRLQAALESADPKVRTTRQVHALFRGVEHHPVTYLGGIVLAARGESWSFCVRTRNDKSRAVTTGGTGPVAVLTDRDCGGVTDEPLVEPPS